MSDVGDIIFTPNEWFVAISNADDQDRNPLRMVATWALSLD